MKIRIILLIVITFFVNAVYAQQDFYNLVTAQPMPVASDNAVLPPVNAFGGVDACGGGNVFWGLEENTLALKEFDITNNVITYTGNTIASCPGYALGISNNLDGSSTSPTFYTGINTNAYYWDGGNSWVLVPIASTLPLYNGAGNGNNIYFMSTTGTTMQFIKYDGNSFSTFYSTTKVMGCADIAIDVDGNFIYVTSGVGGMSDSIYIISPLGQVLNQYPFAVNIVNAYGCFLLNSVFYLALGNGNTIHPNSLIPVTFNGGGITIGNPVSLPPGTILTYDLASCEPGSLLGVHEELVNDKIKISPNPATDNITIRGISGNESSYIIYDANGKEIISRQSIRNREIMIDISNFNRGVYFIELKSEGSVARKRFCKM